MSHANTEKPSPQSPLRVLVVDDEPAARRGVRLLLDRDPEVTVVGEAGDGLEALAQIERLKPELVFLDVQMPGMDGFEVLRRAGPAAPEAVVFVTAYDEHAIRAFEVNAVDYVLKPYEDARFLEAVRRAKAGLRGRGEDGLAARLARLLQHMESGRSAGEEERSDRILIKSSGEILFLKAEEIDWIEAEGDYMKFHAAGRAHLLRETMARLEARLDPKRFVRIHRSTIVNIDRVRKLTPTFAGEYAVILADGTKLRLSRGYHERMQAVMKQAL